MAGEWLAIDVGLPDKPEVQELLDITGDPVEVVVYRLYRLWAWASLHCADGVAKMTPPRLCRVCGGTIDFWRAVESVGWLEFDETAATVAVPGWDRRFSQAAKSRSQHADRSRAYEDRNPGRKRPTQPSGARAPDVPAPTRRRGEDIEEIEDPPPPRDAAQFEDLRTAWNQGPGRPWKPHTPPKDREGVADDQEWLRAALEAIPRLKSCRFFETPVTLPQFMGDGFVANVLGGQYDNGKAGKAGRPALRALDEPAPPREWRGTDAERFEATKRALAERLQVEAS
jgi:hypothetical protein